MRREIPGIGPDQWDRFLAKVRVYPGSSYWVWTAGTTWNGYGLFGIGRSRYLAHRVSWAATHNDNTQLDIDHACGVRFCVSPLHLEAVSRQKNHARMRARQGLATVCSNGHSMHDAYVYARPGGRQQRACRTGKLEYDRARRALQAATP